MTLTYIPDEVYPLISAKAAELDYFVDNVGEHISITVTTTLTCGTPIVQTYDTSEVFDVTKLFYIIVGEVNLLYITPQLYGKNKFVDGIYRVDIKFNRVDGYVLVSNCIFVDITYKCKLAALLKDLITESESAGEDTSTIAHLLHYSLVNASNCGCSCDDMCKIFKTLTDILTGIDPQTLSDCGC